MIDLIAVVGPTAAGKTALGAELARRLDGEVVSADAFAVYRGLDIGTAKPPMSLREAIPHHLVDIADPAERYSAGTFVADADAAIVEIRQRGRTPVVVGGTHFYVRALLHGLFPEPPKDFQLRARLEALWDRDAGLARAWLELLDPQAALRIAERDRQRTLRALEVCLASGEPISSLWQRARREGPRYRFLMLGVRVPHDRLRARIDARVESMFAAGLLEEVRSLVGDGLPTTAHALKAIGYGECVGVLEGRWTTAEAMELTARATRRLAKRQLTWLRRESGVVWLKSTGDLAVVEAMSRVEASGGARTGSFQD